MPSCCVFGCNGSTGNSFPRDTTLRKLWIHAVRRKNWLPTKNSVVCQAHFDPSDYITEGYYSGVKSTKKRVKPGVVPTIFKWSKDKPKCFKGRLHLEGRLAKAVLTSTDQEPALQLHEDLHDGVCEETVDGKPAALSDIHNPDWLPHRNLGHCGGKPLAISDSFNRGKVKRGGKQLYSPGAVNLLLSEEEVEERKFVPTQRDCSLHTVDCEIDVGPVSTDEHFKVKAEPESDGEGGADGETWEPPQFEKVYVKAEHFVDEDRRLAEGGDRIAEDDQATVPGLVVGGSGLPGLDDSFVKQEVPSDDPPNCDEPPRDETSARSASAEEATPEPLTGGAKSHECGVCGKVLASLSSLQHHMLLHELARPHRCEECGTAFTTLYRLEKHATVHAKERPHSCEVCGETFTKASALADHMNTHTGECPFRCEVCGDGFPQCSTLVVHIRTHTGERRYYCTTCYGKFGHSSKDVKHTGESSTKRSNVTNHTKTRTGDHPYLCDLCSYKFARNSALIAHKKRVHNMYDSD